MIFVSLSTSGTPQSAEGNNFRQPAPPRTCNLPPICRRNNFVDASNLTAAPNNQPANPPFIRSGHSEQPTSPANATALTQLSGVVAVILAGCSPFHLLWLLPVSYFTGFLASRSRIIGRLAWLYGYVVAYTIPSNW